ncbi:Hypothetical predicted protein [Prunus dulcis]|uniref:TF-B3 domain-containing protein n=1 Tax=Prunus dulcis TaxID=3755 RepID=A0A5E4ELY7_PRUDU|nr:B3 domain-containing protein Os01g0723500-like [Prunus dulcis]VVA16694.1 Hypothetical predicted protein [Prunus dulcis]
MARKLMKRSVKKESFFKILLGDFSKHLRIPPAFIKNFNGGSLGKCSLRGPSGKGRAVELEERENGLFFSKGWQGFVKDHHLEVGNFLVFRYDGESKFKVTIYDRSACEKDVEVAERGIGSSDSIESKGNQVRVKEEIIDLETENYNEDFENKTSIANRRNCNAMSGKKPTTDYVEETSSESISFKSDHRCFMETMKRHYRYCLMIPKKLAIAEGLNSARNVTLRDPNGRLWLVKLVIRPKTSCKRVEFTTGWGECCQANQISVGDTMVFEFVKQSAIKLHIFGEVNGKRCPVVLDAPNGEN